MDPAWIIALIALATAVLSMAAWASRTVWRVLSRTTRFLDDFFGEPAREGVSVRLGVMARLTALELQVSNIASEVHPNSGHSLRDDVQQTRDDVLVVKSRLRELSDRVEQTGGHT